MYAMDLNQDFDKGKQSKRHIFEQQKEGRIERGLHADSKIQDSWCNMMHLYPNWGDRKSDRPGEDQFTFEYTKLIPLWLNEACPHPHKSAGAAGVVSHGLGGGAKRKVIIS